MMKKPDFFDRTDLADKSKIPPPHVFFFSHICAANAAGIWGWNWLNRQPLEAGTLKPLRKTLETNEDILQSTFNPNRLVKTYSPAEADRKVRRNGTYGLQKETDVTAWRLNVVKENGNRLLFTIDDIKKLPKKDIVFEFKCIEGWSQVQYWSGVPLADFLSAYSLKDQTSQKYIGLQTPDKKYYVGLDMASALHPQTMLCYEMNGEPLTADHGFPLRLIVPVKYGIKNLKCIGTLYFSNEKPPDYWAERGYDYYAGL